MEYIKLVKNKATINFTSFLTSIGIIRERIITIGSVKLTVAPTSISIKNALADLLKGSYNK